jgi:6-phosphogluconolactonase
MRAAEIMVLADRGAATLEAARRFVAIAGAAVSHKGRFAVALAGGSTPVSLYRLLAQTSFRAQVSWRDVLVYLGDERCVAPDDPRSNARMIRETLLEGIADAPPTVRLPQTERLPSEAAAVYASALQRDFGLRGAARPRFDLILLGMGDDGHTASLFPGMPALDDKRHLVVATDVPTYVQPQVPRITFTLPVLNAAFHVIFLVSGASKAPAVAAALAGPEPEDPLPARRVKPSQGQITWLLDAASAAGLR